MNRKVSESTSPVIGCRVPYRAGSSLCRDGKLAGSPGGPRAMLNLDSVRALQQNSNIMVATGLLSEDHDTLQLISGYRALSRSSTYSPRNSVGRPSACNKEFPSTPEPNPGCNLCRKRIEMKVASVNLANGLSNKYPREFLGVEAVGSCSAAIWRLA